jgi:hypothetical protein
MPRRCTWHTMMALYIVYRLQEFRFYRASFWTGEGRYLSVAMFQLTVAFTDNFTDKYKYRRQVKPFIVIINKC